MTSVHLRPTPDHALSGSVFSGYLMPRSTGWAICNPTGHHELAGFFDPFACKKIRVEITVIKDEEVDSAAREGTES